VRGREAAHAIDDVFNPADAAIVAQVDRLEGAIVEDEQAGGKSRR
jgi:hypothetical protein